jgi:hypothetical protein
MFSMKLLCILSLLGTGGVVLIAGIVTQITALIYVSAGLSGIGVVSSIYFYCREQRRPVVFESPVFSPRLYRDPGMKKNKSDTNLELMATTDDGGPSIV